jgi:hypothetical protein
MAVNVAQLLESRKIDPRADLQREALRVAEEYEKEASRRILHMQISMAGLEVRGAKQRGHGSQMQGPESVFFQDEGHMLGSGNGHYGQGQF